MRRKWKRFLDLWQIQNCSQGQRMTRCLDWVKQAAATAANTLPAMIHQTHLAKLVRARRHQQQSTNTASTLGWRTHCGAWFSTHLRESWWRTRSTPGTCTDTVFNVSTSFLINKRRKNKKKKAYSWRETPALASQIELCWKSGEISYLIQKYALILQYLHYIQIILNKRRPFFAMLVFGR